MATIKLRRGDDLCIRAQFFEVDESVSPPTSAPYDMGGWTVEADMQQGTCPPVPLTVEWLDQPAGLAFLRLHNSLTPALELGEYLVQIRGTNPDGHQTSALPQKVIVRA